jgi:hypothetical protein
MRYKLQNKIISRIYQYLLMLVSFLQNELFIRTLLSVASPSSTDDVQVSISPLSMDVPVIAASPAQLVWRPIFQMTS